MANKDFMVIVTARPEANLQLLMQHNGPLAGPCGTVGSSLARRILEGTGRVVVEASYLAPAMDTTYGVREMFDNFDFDVEGKSAPLIYQLLKS